MQHLQCQGASLIEGLVTKYVTEQVKVIRGAFETTWPPIAGMSEKDGCSSIQDLLLAGAKETITAALGQELSAEQQCRLTALMTELVEQELKEWKGYVERNAANTSLSKSRGEKTVRFEGES